MTSYPGVFVSWRRDLVLSFLAWGIAAGVVWFLGVGVSWAYVRVLGLW